MRALVLCAAALLAAGGAFASDAKKSPSKKKAKAEQPKPVPETPKERTLKEMIDFVGENLVGDVLHNTEMEDLGYFEKLKTKRVVYELSPKPKYHARIFKVVYKQDKPNTLILTDAKSSIEGDHDNVVQWDYKSSLDGRLEQIAVVWGRRPKLQSKLVPADPTRRSEFESLKNFLLKDAAALPVTSK